MKRKFTLLLLVLLVFGLFGCAPSDTGTKGQDAVENETLDLYEYEFVYLQRQNEESLYFFGYNEGTELAEAARHRVKDVEQTLNCFISTEQVRNDNLAQTMQLGVASGSAEWSAVQEWGHDFDVIGLIRGDYFLPMSEVEGIIDYKDAAKWGSENMLLPFCYQNELYGIYPNYWPEFGFLCVDHLLCFNLDLAKESGVGDPRTMLEQGTWNRTAFSDLVQDLTLERPEEKIYGFGVNHFHFYEMAFLTDGGTYVQETEDGYTDRLNTMETVESFTWADDFFAANETAIYPSLMDTDLIVDLFCKEKISMCLTHSYFIFSQSEKIAYEVENQGLLPFPLKDGDTSQNWMGQFERMEYALHIPVTAVDVEASAHILNAIYEPLAGYETKDDRMAYYNRTLFHDERDCALIMQLMDNIQYTFRMVATPEAKKNLSAPNIVADTAYRKSGTPLEMLEAQKTVFETQYYPAIVDVLESAKTVFGE